jgi:hypothetical protein
MAEDNEKPRNRAGDKVLAYPRTQGLCSSRGPEIYITLKSVTVSFGRDSCLLAAGNSLNPVMRHRSNITNNYLEVSRAGEGGGVTPC